MGERLVNLSRVGPGGTAGDDVELSEETADDLVGVTRHTQSIELRHYLGERTLDVLDRVLGIVLALLIEAALTAHTFLTVEIGKGVNNGIPKRTRICQEARRTVP